MNAQEIIDQIKPLIKGFASREERVSLQFFQTVQIPILQIVRLNPAFQEVDEMSMNAYYEVAVKDYKSVFGVDINPSSSLIKEGFKTWLTEERKKQLPKDYITRYLSYMRKEGRSENVISELSRSSEAILSKLGDPQSAKGFYYKGLVVGSVQSGKTGNFNAVINRAIDAGYNLIIVDGRLTKSDPDEVRKGGCGRGY
jgi:transposase